MHPFAAPYTSRLIATLAALVPLAATSGCELFGQVACEDDDDCPGSLPFCVEDVCAAEADDGRGGRGIDDDGCTVDTESDDCPGGLCDEDGAFVEAGTCLPPEGTEDCEELSGANPRDAAGPVIFALAYEPIGDGCYANVTFSYLDRDGDVSQTSPVIALVSNGSEVTQSGFSEDGVTMSIGTMCGGDPVASAGLAILDNAGNHSNTLCVHPTPAP